MAAYVLDTNIIVRYLTFDPPQKGEAALRLFEDAAKGHCTLYLDNAVLAEVIYVVIGYYKQPRKKVALALFELLANPGIRSASIAVLQDALLRFKESKSSFIDALVASLAAEQKCAVASFDRDLDAFRDIRRFSPE